MADQPHQGRGRYLQPDSYATGRLTAFISATASKGALVKNKKMVGMSYSAYQRQISSLPLTIGSVVERLALTIDSLLTPALVSDIRGVILTGCGDSHHAALAAVLAFHQLAGLPCQAYTAMEFARYKAGFLDLESGGRFLVMAVSASGQVSRTIEALDLARSAGALSVAVTGDGRSSLTQASDVVIETAIPPIEGELPGTIVPGSRSFIASLLALYMTAIQVGRARNHLTESAAAGLHQTLLSVSGAVSQTLDQNRPAVAELAQQWADASHFVFCGAGPNYGSALFSAAKMLEASGDNAVGQDLEEWAHLNYFGREATTPTFIISAGGWEEDRASEITTAAKTIGRRVVIITPGDSALAKSPHKDVLLPIASRLPECFSPLLMILPALLFSAERATLVGEIFFRGFTGGRSIAGGGGISRIRTSRRIRRARS